VRCDRAVPYSVPHHQAPFRQRAAVNRMFRDGIDDEFRAARAAPSGGCYGIPMTSRGWRISRIARLRIRQLGRDRGRYGDQLANCERHLRWRPRYRQSRSSRACSGHVRRAAVECRRVARRELQDSEPIRHLPWFFLERSNAHCQVVPITSGPPAGHIRKGGHYLPTSRMGRALHQRCAALHDRQSSHNTNILRPSSSEQDPARPIKP
jgi:hypothetical protein